MQNTSRFIIITNRIYINVQLMFRASFQNRFHIWLPHDWMKFLKIVQPLFLSGVLCLNVEYAHQESI